MNDLLMKRVRVPARRITPMPNLTLTTEHPWIVEQYHDVRPEDAVLPEGFEQDAREYEELGLSTLALQAKRRTKAAPGLGRVLSAEELRVWAWRYPTAYSTPRRLFYESSLFDQASYRWEELGWPVPRHVRTLIREAGPVFQSLEIWTPELCTSPSTLLSPILLGFRDGQYYLLARWAEALEPFEEIRAKALSFTGRWASRVRQRTHNPVSARWEYAVPFFFTALGGFVTLVSLINVANGEWSSAVLIQSALLTAAIGGFGIWQYCRVASSWARQKACAYAGWVYRPQRY